MESLLLFCCRACLKGDGENNKEYYDLLGVDQKASAEHIKKAYKKQSLQMHPDKLAQKGVEVTAEHSLKFQKMKDAYDILSDPRKRRLYDEIGESGLKLLESPQDLNPADLIKNFQKNRADRAKIAVGIAVIFSIILIGPILFCLKCDGTIPAEWLAIWAPMWGLDLILLIGAGFTLADNYEPPVEEGEEPTPKEPFLFKLFMAIKTVLFVLMQVFILMRLDNRVNWSLFIVFIPWFLWEAASAVSWLPKAIKQVSKPEDSSQNGMLNADEDEQHMQAYAAETKYYEDLMHQLVARKTLIVQVLRIWQLVFIAIKTDGHQPWDWGLVLLPIWLYFLVQLGFGYLLHRWGTSLNTDIDVPTVLSNGGEVDPMVMIRHQHSMELKAQAVAMIFFQIVPLYMALLLVIRLQIVSFSTFIILLPIYIAIGCCICGVGCALCCLSSIDMDTLDLKMKEAQENMEGKPASQEPQPVPQSDTAVYGTFHEEAKDTAATTVEKSNTTTVPPPAAAAPIVTPPVAVAVPYVPPPVEERAATPPQQETSIDTDID
mmetsp:Transcript_11634/g.11666  ORF Transcript_11634/g.11666 Transcript_11634/m.11666 type:complete len:545 (+) Transcript_11634:174-1808(+)|eukprot:CAMPEP_0182418098 /NCGR_PEP_ID=MMETSP1167-20130531/2562_1 /TAXON_ID=2988 /ORGANISM="Mallomonas Sp, Strain CCMP3275" /LENGTH=544 /DNA_ID=CAMNT_0024592103 /DNA_START=48 /DNA_END=1682 /DNA_ORIENTATION=-